MLAGIKNSIITEIQSQQVAQAMETEKKFQQMEEQMVKLSQ